MTSIVHGLQSSKIIGKAQIPFGGLASVGCMDTAFDLCFVSQAKMVLIALLSRDYIMDTVKNLQK